MLKHLRNLLTVVTIAASLVGCATRSGDKMAAEPEVVVDAIPDRAASDIQKIADLERQLVKEQRQCYAEKRRLDLSLKESQKQSEELQKKLDDLQKKLDALLEIDRDLRNRNR
ncbi:protein bicaudal D homolog [Ferribacterium limneticum]|uniref:protein bicaudal D homolog n=1 Tax=Ferribacterium limneticum TaxID=76259 RepID=UPI001CF89F0D|nr:protein bicaudal D homolog [Ferribacterium limneticum]UCV24254.1 hypothetical protein KI613_06990 [Ferribacterium limneticum]